MRNREYAQGAIVAAWERALNSVLVYQNKLRKQLAVKVSTHKDDPGIPKVVHMGKLFQLNMWC